MEDGDSVNLLERVSSPILTKAGKRLVGSHSRKVTTSAPPDNGREWEKL